MSCLQAILSDLFVIQWNPAVWSPRQNGHPLTTANSLVPAKRHVHVSIVNIFIH